jgi:hypothetical protein
MSVSSLGANLDKCTDICQSVAVCANGTTSTLSPLAYKNSQDLWWAAQKKIRGVSKPKAKLVCSEDITAFMRDGIFIPQG